MGRRFARELALKVLYRYEEGDKDLPVIFSAVVQRKKYADGDKAFCRELVETTIHNLECIDKEIKKVLKNWPYDRLSVIDKTIIRLGTCEVLFFTDIPARVSINEAIEIGKRYGGGDSGKFINGILDAVKKNYESSDNK